MWGPPREAGPITANALPGGRPHVAERQDLRMLIAEQGVNVVLAGIGWDHRERQPIQEVEMEEVPRTLLKLANRERGIYPQLSSSLGNEGTES
jgi:predicted kinase